jgi:hypothetical protein
MTYLSPCLISSIASDEHRRDLPVPIPKFKN